MSILLGASIYRHRWYLSIIVLITIAIPSYVFSQSALSLADCRNRALQHNKTLQIADEMVRQAQNLRLSARGAYFPALDFTGTYFYNGKNLQLIDVERLRSAISAWGVPSTVVSALVPDNLLELDTHNVTLGAITLTQPLFLGGKIIALNKIADNAELLSQSQRRLSEKEVIAAVDDAYWLVVSLVYKHKLALSVLALTDSLNRDINAMYDAGIVTHSDVLAVDVALNEAEVALAKVEDGLSLSRMLLAQMCGMPLDTIYTLQDEDALCNTVSCNYERVYNLDKVYQRREEIQGLGYMAAIARWQQQIALSSMLPSVALIGTYTIASPNLYNGFQQRFEGMFRVGILLRVPIFHWGSDYYRYKASRSTPVIAAIEIEAAKERIALQLSQAVYRVKEADKIFQMTQKNMISAQQNMENARIAFMEGLYTARDMLAAQTAWQQAHSEMIDAHINLFISHNNFERAMGVALY